MKVTTVDQMRELDRRAIQEFAIPGEILMENAGLAAALVVQRETGARGLRFLVVCGVGHNGGDGLVVARRLHSNGGNVTTFVFGDPGKYDHAPAMNYEMLQKSGSKIVVQPTLDEATAAIADCDLVVDALLGTGITRDVKSPYREVIERINDSSVAVCSLDIPSGVDGNTGRVCGTAIRADYTVTFGMPKLGNLLYPGADLGGRLFVSHICFPPDLQESEVIQTCINEPKRLPRRRADGHKGTFGDVLFIAGAASYFGAPTFAALSLLKAGGGYARLAAPRSVIPVSATLGSEIVFAPQEETPEGSLALVNATALLEMSEKVDLVVLGPGLSLVDETQDLVRKLCSSIDKPLLIDGDGLTAMARAPEILSERSSPTILTPHVAEMARLRGASITDVQLDPVGAARQAAQALGSTVVLKGAHSLIAELDGMVHINLSGNSGMATAGSGDVLTGTIAAMFGLGMTLDEAVRTGVFMHGYAGDLAARSCGEDGMTARDILEHLPRATKSYRENYDDLVGDHYGSVVVV